MAAARAQLEARGITVNNQFAGDAFFIGVNSGNAVTGSSPRAFLLSMLDRVLVDQSHLPTSASDRALRLAVKSTFAQLKSDESAVGVHELGARLFELRLDSRFSAVSHKTRVRYEFGNRLVNVLAAKQSSGVADLETLENLAQVWDELLPT